jgi:hypothetical protein
VLEIQDQLAALSVAMFKSPDLIEAHANVLMDEFYSKVKAAKERIYKLSGGVLSTAEENGYWHEMSKKIRTL